VKRKRHSLLAIGLAVVISGCGTPRATQAPASTAAASASTSAPAEADRWVVADIEQPSAVQTAPSLEPGYQCHPCHFLAENELFDVADSSIGPIAVGVQQPPAQAVAFTLPDRGRWVPLPGFSGADGSSALGVASRDERIVIVGQDATGATTWASDGANWRQAPHQNDLEVPYSAGAMSAVTTFGDEFVAGGYRDDPLHSAASAAAWRSRDGLTWRADDGGTAFAGGRILDIATGPAAVVAVGTHGDPTYGPAAAWRWTKTSGWQRARLEPDDSGAMRGVTTYPGGFVAVGANADDHGARVWTSADGLTWTVVPDQPAFHYYTLPVRMHTVVAMPDGLVAAGLRFDAGKGSAVVWTSPDGTAWESRWETSFSGGEIDGLAANGNSIVAVGRTGYPDWNTATIWVTPAP